MLSALGYILECLFISSGCYAQGLEGEVDDWQTHIHGIGQDHVLEVHDIMSIH